MRKSLTILKEKCSPFSLPVNPKINPIRVAQCLEFPGQELRLAVVLDVYRAGSSVSY